MKHCRSANRKLPISCCSVPLFLFSFSSHLPLSSPCPLLILRLFFGFSVFVFSGAFLLRLFSHVDLSLLRFVFLLHLLLLLLDAGGNQESINQSDWGRDAEQSCYTRHPLIPDDIRFSRNLIHRSNVRIYCVHLAVFHSKDIVYRRYPQTVSTKCFHTRQDSIVLFYCMSLYVASTCVQDHEVGLRQNQFIFSHISEIIMFTFLFLYDRKIIFDMFLMALWKE